MGASWACRQKKAEYAEKIFAKKRAAVVVVHRHEADISKTKGRLRPKVRTASPSDLANQCRRRVRRRLSYSRPLASKVNLLALPFHVRRQTEALS
jgi:hypothetical protein